MALPVVECKFVTEDRIQEWKSSAIPDILQVEVPPTRFVYELCWTLIRGDLPFSKCRAAMNSVEFAETPIREEMASILADTIAHMGQELTVPGDLRSRLIEMAKWLVESGLVSVKLLQERCEAEFLWEVDMIKIKAADLKSKEVRVNTRLLYQQTKFNLLREESEGYAKLVTVLSQRGPDGLTEYNAPFVISTIKSLIGHFDLDPNRVFDIVLECYELQPENKSFLELMPLFPKSHTCHILGFKFQYYQRLEVTEPVPIGLYILAATLIKEDFIDLDSIYAHLLPKDEDSFEQYEEFSKRRLDEANKIGKINLAATGKDLMEEEKPGDVTIDLYAPLDMESEAALEHSNEMLTNQKLGLLVGFLSVYDWPHAHLLFERLSPLNPIAHLQICNGLFRAIERAIAPSYAFVRPAYLAKLGSSSITGNLARTCEVETKHVSQPAPFVELGKEFFQMLSCAGPYLHRDALLLQKVCRVLRGYYASAQALATSQGPNISAIDIGEGERKDPRFFLKEARARVEEALGACLLPSLQLLPANPAVGLEIWDVLSLLPYEVRYRLYGEWEKDDERIPIILAARQTAKLDTRRILKRLAKENLKQLGRMVAKISHANPMTVLRTIVHQIEAYKDMITPVVDAFKYLTQLEYDVLEYVVIERLAQGGREKLKEDGLNLSDWLQSLASFWGSLCKKYPSMELRGLFQYLVNQLKRGEGVELVVLQELIQQMANVEYTENMTEDQLEAMAGGETLRFQATSFGITRNNKALLKSTNRLRDTLLPRDEPKLAVPLLLLIAQQRSNVVITADAPYIKMVSEQFDRCHGTLLQYVEFLTSAVTPVTAYAQLIPSLDDLVHKYHTEPEVVFLVYRPVMRLFKPFKGATIGWPLDNTRQLSQSDESMEGSSSVATNDLIMNLGAPRKTLMWSELLASIHSMLPPKAWNSLSPELYATFWGLTIHDLYVPRRRYEIEISKQQASLKSLEENTDNSHTAITKRKKDKEKIQEVLERLSAELLKQEQHVAAVHQRLLQEKDSWLTSCPDSLKINMEFLQRCIFPRCVVSMLDAIYCARFVHTLHSLGTPFFNTVNHIDVLICKTLQPMISSCTEYEAGRLGRFLYETLKMAYHWKSDEVVYERECGNMPGFAVLYRDPNSPRVTFVQFIRVHWKWSSRITKLLIQCLESSEYIEIRNSLTVLTKISSVFPVTRKSGMNLEKRVSKIKGDEREDLKVLATGVSAALAARKSAWVTDEDFGMGYIDFKPAASPAKLAGPTSSAPITNVVSQADGKASTHGIETASSDQEALISGAGTLPSETGSGRLESAVQGAKSEPARLMSKLSNANISKDSHLSLAQVTALAQAEAAKSVSGVPKNTEGLSRTASGLQGTVGSDGAKQVTKSTSMDNENRAAQRRVSTSISQASISKSVKQEAPKDDSRASSAVGQVPSSTLVSTAERECSNYASESSRQRTSGTVLASVVTNGTASISVAIKSTVGEKKGTPESATKVRQSADLLVDAKLESSKISDRKGPGDYEVEGCDSHDAAIAGQLHSKSPGREEATSALKFVGDASKERIHKRSTIAEETERLNKRRKADASERSGEVGEVRALEKERVIEQRAPERPRSIEHEKPNHDDRSLEKMADRSTDRGKGERMDRDYRGADRPLERLDRIRGEDVAADRSRDRSLERFGRERSVDRVPERGSSFDRSGDRGREERLKDDRVRPRYELTAEQPHPDDRFPMQNLPPPPPLPPNMVPQSLPGARREEDDPRRTVRIASRASPHREEKLEKRRADEGSITVVDDSKRRRDEDIRDRKRDDRESLSMKVDKEREREKEKAILLKDDEGAAALSKRRRLKRDHLSSSEIPANFGPSPPLLPPPPPPPVPVSQQYDRDRERKGNAIPRGMYMEDPTYDKGLSSRVHGKDASKIARRDHEQPYDREWDEEKRRGDIKRRHHRK